MQTNVVQVPVVVRDGTGKAVAGLTKSEFLLYDNGHPVEISSFSVENSPTLALQNAATSQSVNGSAPEPGAPVSTSAPTPRYIALLFDDTSMRVGDVVMARTAAERFVRSSLKPGDRIGIFTTSTTVSLDFTDNIPALLGNLAKLETHRNRGGNGSRCSRINPYLAYSIMQFYNVHTDAFDLGRQLCGVEVLNAARENLALAEQFAQDTLGIINDVIHYLGRMPGHRVMVLSSSGFLTQTLTEKQNKVIDEALKANVVINTLDAKGLVADIPNYDEDGRPIALRDKWQAQYDLYKSQNREYENDPLALIAEGTGGQFFHNRNDLDVGLRDMLGAPDVSYMLSFSPADLKANGAAHELKVKVLGVKGASIQSRRGYLAPSPNRTKSEKRQRRLDAAVLAATESQGFPARVVTEFEDSVPTETNLKITVRVDAEKLPFQTQGDRKVERLVFITALFDLQDRFVTGVEGIMDLRLKEDTLKALSAQGVNARLSIRAPSGSYRLRQVVEEVGDGRIAATSRAIRIP